MRILGIDTSSRFNTIGLINGEQILADSTWEAKDDSLQKIILDVDLVLGNEGFTLADVEGFAAGIGPGSWTGMRVGITVAKILAYATGKPICGVSSLDALAYQAGDVPTLLCPLIDAGRENVYAAFYRPHGETIVRESEYYVGHVKGLLEMINEPTLFLGSAVCLHHEFIVKELGPLANYKGEPLLTQRGSSIALLALPRFKKGESDDPLSLSPLYLKEAAAQALARRAPVP